MEDFVFTAALLKLGYAGLGVLLLVGFSRWLDRRAGVNFGAVLLCIHRDSLATALYFGARILALALLVAALMGCSAAGAQTIPGTYDSRIRAAVARYWPDFPDPLSWKAQLYQESRLDPAAVSPVGAAGLAQFMPATWAEVTRELRLGRASPHAEIAIEAGAYYMAKLRRGWTGDRPATERHRLAQASYNAGLGSILAAQARCGGARLWDAMAPCLPAVTGAQHARETTGYVASIARWRAVMLAQGAS